MVVVRIMLGLIMVKLIEVVVVLEVIEVSSSLIIKQLIIVRLFKLIGVVPFFVSPFIVIS